MKKSRTALNIDKINRQLDRITNTFGGDSLEISNYIKENGLTDFDLYRTDNGNIRVRNNKANRKNYQKIAAVSKKSVKRFIARSKQAYQPPKVKKSPIPPQMPEKPTTKQYKAAARLLATLSEIKEYIYETYPELDYDQRQELAHASGRKAPRVDNMPQVVDETYREMYKDLFDDELTDDFENVDTFGDVDIFNDDFTNTDFGI